MVYKLDANCLKMIHPSIIALCVCCQVVEDLFMYPFRQCRSVKEAIRHSVSMSGYSACEPHLKT